MWGPRYLTTVWASTACYRDSFIPQSTPLSPTTAKASATTKLKGENCFLFQEGEGQVVLPRRHVNIPSLFSRLFLSKARKSSGVVSNLERVQKKKHGIDYCAIKCAAFYKCIVADHNIFKIFGICS
jgi:hypothetical protein